MFSGFLTVVLVAATSDLFVLTTVATWVLVTSTTTNLASFVSTLVLVVVVSASLVSLTVVFVHSLPFILNPSGQLYVVLVFVTCFLNWYLVIFWAVQVFSGSLATQLPVGQ
jgi:hypothetical protein